MTTTKEFEDASTQSDPEGMIRNYSELLDLIKSGKKEFEECHKSWSAIIVEKDKHISELTARCSELTELNETLKEQVKFYADAIRILEKQMKKRAELVFEEGEPDLSGLEEF